MRHWEARAKTWDDAAHLATMADHRGGPSPPEPMTDEAIRLLLVSIYRGRPIEV
jgi:hypothetical protein